MRLPKSVKQHRSSFFSIEFCFVCQLLAKRSSLTACARAGSAVSERACWVCFLWVGFFLLLLCFASFFSILFFFFFSPTPEEKAPRSNAGLRRCRGLR